MHEASLTAFVGWAATWSDTLWRASWQGGLFILAVALVCRFAPRIPPAARCCLWWLACLKLLTGAAGVALFTLPVLPAPGEGTALNAVGPSARSGLSLDLSPLAPLPASGRGETGSRPVPADPRPAYPFSDSPSPLRGGGWGERLTPFLLPAWLLGVLVHLTLAARHGLAARRLQRSAQPLEHESTLEAARQLGARLGLRRLPPLVTSQLPRGPMVVGPLPTRVVLRANALESLSPIELRLALAHELAHVRRGDLWLALVPGLARALFFFHPLAWLACREWATARKAACDSAALQATGAAPAAYGRLLLKLAAAGAGLAPTAGVGAAPSYLALRGRVVMLQYHSHRPCRSLRAGATALLTLAALIALPFRLTAQTASAGAVTTERPAIGDPSTQNLQKLATALKMYAQDYDKQLPPMKSAEAAKQSLLPYVRRDASVFISPTTGQPYRTNPSISGERLSSVVLYRDLQMRRPYARYRATITAERAAATVAYYEASPGPDGTRAVLFLNGRVMRVREADWPRIKQESGIR